MKATSVKPLNPLIPLDLRKAADACMKIAAGQERAGISSAADHWMNLAEEIESGRYLSLSQVDDLLKKAPFLREFLR